MLFPTRPLRVSAAITPHGFGHAAVTLAVLDALDGLVPQGIDVTFITRVPEAVLRARWGRPCTVVAHAAATDFGMLMRSSTAVRVADSVAAYAQAHDRWDAVVVAEEAVLAAARPDVVVTCASYAALAAAQRLGLPNVALGPFTWYDILRAYAPEKEDILGAMRTTYEAAGAVIATTPAVPMDFANLRTVGPVGRPGRARRGDLAAALGVEEGERMALVALGGIAEDLPVTGWPAVAGWRWVVPDAAQAGGAVVALEGTGFSVSDAIASCDAVVTKPGYGTFVEAACAGTPLLYRDRPDWPETGGMARWMSDYAPCLRIDSETFAAGRMGDHLRMSVTAPRRPLGYPPGNRQAAEIILDQVLSERGVQTG